MTEEEKKQQKELWKQDRIRARREEWEKIRKLGPGAKLQYLWDYYKIVLALAAALVLVIYLAVTMIQGARTSTLLYACFLNTDTLDPDTETLQNDYIEARGGIKKLQNMVFDSSVWVNPDSPGTSQQDVAASIKITSYVGAGALDVFLAPSYVTKFEQENGLLMDLGKLLTEEEIRTLSEAGYLYYDKVPETENLSRDQGRLKQEEAAKEETETEQTGNDGAQTRLMKETESEILPDRTSEGAFGPASGQEEVALPTQPGEGMHIYAVRIDPSGVIGNYDIYAPDRQVWFSIVGNSGRAEESIQFLRFLLGKIK